MILAWTVISAFVAALLLTTFIREYALRHRILDIPNERSSHEAPTPRGGGLAIAVVMIVALIVLWLAGVVPARLAAALTVGGAAIAALGWIDDKHGLAALPRGLVQLGAAIVAVVLLGGVPVIHIGEFALRVGLAGSLLAVVLIVWFTNLYNFMDGIDGLAAGEAVSVGLIAALLLWNVSAPLAIVAGVMAASSAGYLVWNWPPAKIFMGDSGSGLLGYSFAVLALASENAGALPTLWWIVLLGAFTFDATITLVRRVLQGKAIYQAHRDHAYQRLVRYGRTHRAVTSAVLALNIVLAALAWAGWRASTPVALAIVTFALILLAAPYLWVERRLPMGG